MTKKKVPHDHYCSVCNGVIGCDDDECNKSWFACKPENNPECEKIAEAATVHQQPERGNVLPCCGQVIGETKRGDRMSQVKRDVTCKGSAASAETAA